MTLVVKRNYTKERFDGTKIRRSIEAAARDAKLPKDRLRRLIRDMSRNVIEHARKEKEIRSTTIREAVLDTLDASAPEVSRAWRDYDRRTKGLT